MLEEHGVNLHAAFAGMYVELVAPSHIQNEVANAIAWARKGDSARLTSADGRFVLDQFLNVELPTVNSPELLLLAFDLAHRYSHSIYDCIYLALSDELPAPLITADRRFYDKVHHAHDVRWLGDLDLPLSS